MLVEVLIYIYVTPTTTPALIVEDATVLVYFNRILANNCIRQEAATPGRGCSSSTRPTSTPVACTTTSL
jgi:hypothetical protein